MGFLIFLVAFAVIVIWYFAALEFYEIAKEKGYSNKKYLWWTFFLGVVGCLLVVALPDRGNHQSNNVAIDELPEL